MNGNNDSADSYSGCNHPHVESQIDEQRRIVAPTTLATTRNSQTRHTLAWGRKANRCLLPLKGSVHAQNNAKARDSEK